MYGMFRWRRLQDTSFPVKIEIWIRKKDIYQWRAVRLNKKKHAHIASSWGSVHAWERCVWKDRHHSWTSAQHKISHPKTYSARFIKRKPESGSLLNYHTLLSQPATCLSVSVSLAARLLDFSFARQRIRRRGGRGVCRFCSSSSSQKRTGRDPRGGGSEKNGEREKETEAS